jgi:hypothetical protein
MGNTPMRADNSRHLVAAAQRRSDQTLARAQQALRELQTAGQPISVAAVAAHAGVSRAWLYTQPELRQQITALRHATPPAPPPIAPTPASDASLRQRLTLAHQRIHELTDQNQQLRDKIAALHGQLRAAKIGTATRVADTVQHAERRETPAPRA